MTRESRPAPSEQSRLARARNHQPAPTKHEVEVASNSARFTELDAVRGIAALFVVFSHLALLVYPLPDWLHLLFYTPCRIIIGGHQAVIYFFLLSGLVLALPFAHQKDSRYWPFIVKRIFRIYVPYFAALWLAVLANSVYYGQIKSLSPWFNMTWTTPPGRHLIVQHVLFLGDYNYSAFNTAFWSLVYEMRISFIFPFICVLIRKLGVQKSLVGAIALSLAGKLLSTELGHPQFFITFHYLAIFIVGAEIAFHRAYLKDWFDQVARKHYFKIILGMIVLLAYGEGPMRRHFFNTTIAPLNDWPVVVAGVGTIIYAMNSATFGNFLRRPLLQFLGKISYSLYLVHATVLFAVVHGLYPGLPIKELLVPIVAGSLALSVPFYYLIEFPSMRAGRALGAWLTIRAGRGPKTLAPSASL